MGAKIMICAPPHLLPKYISNFGVEVTGPNGDGWIHAIDHTDIEVTYIPVNPIEPMYLQIHQEIHLYMTLMVFY